MSMTPAERQRKSRATAKIRREEIAPALSAVGRLGEWDENNLQVIDEAILQLAVDWAVVINADVTCDEGDPVPRRMVANELFDSNRERTNARKTIDRR